MRQIADEFKLMRTTGKKLDEVKELLSGTDHGFADHNGMGFNPAERTELFILVLHSAYTFLFTTHLPLPLEERRKKHGRSASEDP